MVAMMKSLASSGPQGKGRGFLDVKLGLSLRNKGTEKWKTHQKIAVYIANYNRKVTLIIEQSRLHHFQILKLCLYITFRF